MWLAGFEEKNTTGLFVCVRGRLTCSDSQARSLEARGAAVQTMLLGAAEKATALTASSTYPQRMPARVRAALS